MSAIIHLRSLLDATSDAALLLSAEGTVLAANALAARLVRKGVERLVGTSVLEIVPPPLRRISLKVVHRVVKRGKEVCFQRRSADRMLDVTLRPVFGLNAQVDSVAVLIRDVTQQLAREQARQHQDALLETIAHAATRLLYESSWEEGVEDVLERIGLALQADRVVVLIREEEGTAAHRFRPLRKWSSSYADRLDSDMAEGPACISLVFGRWTATLAKGQHVAGDAASFPSKERKALAAAHVRSLIAMPIFCRDRWWGLLCACSEESERDWQSAEIEAVRVATDTLGAAILRAQVEAELSEANRELRESVENLEARSRNSGILSEMSDMLQGAVHDDEALQVAADCAESLFPASAGAIYLQPEPGANLRMAASWGPSSGWVSSFAKDDCWALRRGKAHGRNRQQKLTCQHVLDAADETADWRWLCVPILGQSNALGLLSLAQSSHTAPDTAEYLAQEVADRLGTALANLALRKELEFLSTQDPLTGLFNRRHMEATLQTEIERATRHGRTVSILMMDLDHFKSLNDRFGHDAGDTFLREFAAYLRLRFRTADIACRYGGEEFVVIMPETTVENAEIKSRQLREHVRRLIVEHQSTALGKTTVSVGIAGFPDHGKTPEELLRAADRALYEAKRKGRDRSVIATAAGSS